MIRMMLLFVFIAVFSNTVKAQIPSLGFCPEYLPMAGFDMERFAGTWFEAERYFQLTEVASRCVKANYTKGPDGKFHVTNEVTSRFTGVKRVLEGEIRKAPSKAEEGKLHVKYTTVPFIPLETQYNVLETDYDNYAVMWSCSGLGPLNTQNAWIMTRLRNPPGEIMQKAYGVLDKYKISKLFFLKTNNDDCAYLDSIQAEQAALAASNRPTEPPKQADDDEYEQEQAAKKATMRQNVEPDISEAALKARRTENIYQEDVSPVVVEKVAPVEVPAEPTVVVEPLKSSLKSSVHITEEVKEVIKEPEPLTQSDVVPSVEQAKDNLPIAEVIKADI